METPLRILMLEDDEADAELVVRELRRAGIEFTSTLAQDRSSFLAALDEGRPGLILADYSLPGFDGLSAVAMARERYQNVPAIIVSGAIGEETAIEALKAGATDYVLKQRLSRLGPVVERALEEAQRTAERLAAEQALQRTRTTLTAAMASMTDAVFIADTEGRFIDLNDAGATFHRFPSKDDCPRVLSEYRAILDVSFPDGTPAPPDMWAVPRALRGERATNEEYLLRRKDTGENWVGSYSFGPIRDGSGAIAGAVVVGRDITERKRAEAQLRELNETLERRVEEQTAQVRQAYEATQAERQRLYDVLETMPTMICLLTPDYHVAFANRAFREQFGESHGRYCYEYCFGRAEPCEFCESFEPLRTGRPHHWEVTTPEGAVIDAHDFPFTDVDGSPMVLEMDIDITEQRRNEQALARRTAEVQDQADQLRALAAELAQTEQRERKRLARVLHDHVQQLLAAACLQVGWMKRDAAGERMQATVQGVDSILREAIQACRSLAVDLSPPLLHEAGLAGALSWLGARVREQHGLNVQVRSDSRAEPATEEMRSLLFEGVRELLFNVAKHAGVKEARVTLIRTRDGQARITVRDEGRGFDAGLLSKRRPDEVTFGLFSIRERLAHVGGRMTVESAPGQGTTVTLTAPLGQADAPAPDEVQEKRPTERAEHARPPRRSDRCRVLIVDDHKIMREGLVQLFQFEPDIDVVGEASDGDQAIDMAEKLDPDVIIMDVNLGAVSGVEATRRILSRSSRPKVIGLSMHADGDVADSMRGAGAAAYLTKDGPSKDLIAAVRACSPAGQPG